LSDTAAKGAEPSRFTERVKRSLREVVIILMGAIALMLLAALVTYDPADPGFSFTGEGASDIHNLIGLQGAWLADTLFFLFGGPAFLFPLMLAGACWIIFRSRGSQSDDEGEPVSRINSFVRAGGFALLLAASCALATLHFAPGELRQSAGGVVGSLVGEWMRGNFNFVGGTLLLLACAMAGFSLASGISWLTIVDRTGGGFWGAIDWLRARRQQQAVVAEGEERKAARKESLEVQTKKAANKPKPRIEAPAPQPEKSERIEKERQVPMFTAKAGELPPLQLLDDPPARESTYSAEALEAMSRLVELKLKDFGVEVEVVAVQPGPVVTRFELRPAPGVKASQISSLSKDLARALSAISVRVVEVIPGKSVMGLEIPNEKREIVTFGEIVKSRAYDEVNSPLALALGKDIGGLPVVADLQRMPHLLVAGTTGSGKSVAVNAMILSMLYKSTAEDVRLIMIDPKMLELSVYEGIPHLLAPVVTDMKEAANALRWCVAEMERRYQLMAAMGVRNISGFNRKVKDAIDEKKPIKDPVIMKRASNDPSIDQSQIPDLAPLPFIVVIIDELADLMMIVGKKVEELIARLAQKARASGIHLILATQRPSVDVITGLIKSNIPTRIAFQVSSKIDSRTILDQMGAENLLGHGDMLYLPPGTSLPERIHGAFVDDHEVHDVVAEIKKQGKPNYVEGVLQEQTAPVLPGEVGQDSTGADQDALYDEAVAIVTETRKASISYVQRRLKIGYNRAARMIEEMEATGVVTPVQSNGSREVLAPAPPSMD
jgi:S-DNA-T family DNA segregation ATPase FtsK/SpoIIIE